MLCIKEETILCHSLVSEDMAKCIVQLHFITGCDANSSFYGKGKLLLLKCGNNLDVDEDTIGELFKSTCSVIYGDNKSSCMAEACTEKWKAMKRSPLFEFLQMQTVSQCVHKLRFAFLVI